MPSGAAFSALRSDRAGLEASPIEIDPASTSCASGAALESARGHRLSGYDAAHLEPAVRMQLPLAPLDQALGAAAGRAEGMEAPASGA